MQQKQPISEKSYSEEFIQKSDFVIDNNIFESDIIAKTIYMGRYASNYPVVVKNNKFKADATFEDAFVLQKHSNIYTVSYIEENNEFANLSK